MAIRIKTSPQFCPKVKPLSAEYSYQIACHRKDEGGKADNCYWRKNGHERIHAYEAKEMPTANASILVLQPVSILLLSG